MRVGRDHTDGVTAIAKGSGQHRTQGRDALRLRIVVVAPKLNAHLAPAGGGSRATAEVRLDAHITPGAVDCADRGLTENAAPSRSPRTSGRGPLHAGPLTRQATSRVVDCVRVGVLNHGMDPETPWMPSLAWLRAALILTDDDGYSTSVMTMRPRHSRNRGDSTNGGAGRVGAVGETLASERVSIPKPTPDQCYER